MFGGVLLALNSGTILVVFPIKKNQQIGKYAAMFIHGQLEILSNLSVYSQPIRYEGIPEYLNLISSYGGVYMCTGYKIFERPSILFSDRRSELRAESSSLDHPSESVTADSLRGGSAPQKLLGRGLYTDRSSLVCRISASFCSTSSDKQDGKASTAIPKVYKPFLAKYMLRSFSASSMMPQH